MFYLYIIRFNDGDLYTGVTNNLERRLIEHQSGRSEYTKNKGGFRLVYTEEFTDLKSAKKKEWELKCTPWGGRLKKKLINYFDRDPGSKAA